MWPLAHVSSVIAFNYDMYPKETHHVVLPDHRLWQKVPVLALQRIQTGAGPKTLEVICREVRRVLMETVRILGVQVGYGPSRTFVLAVHHTIASNFLFLNSSVDMSLQQK